MSRHHSSQHANYDDAASALIELAGHTNNYASGAADGGVNSSAGSGEMAAGRITTLKPSPAAVAAANRFPGKLMSVLNSDAYQTIITWSPDGKSFVFLDSNSFERVVLPSIFKVAKFDSFLRKLYRWGFSKCQAHSKVGCPAYKHEKFMRDRPDLITKMECRSKPKTQYGNAAPLTLRAFHQSAPQLGESSKVGPKHATLPNASWDQVYRENTPRSSSEHSDVSMNDNVGNSVDYSMSNSPIPVGFEHQRKILEAARAAILRGDALENANIQTFAQHSEVGMNGSLANNIGNRSPDHQSSMNSLSHLTLPISGIDNQRIMTEASRDAMLKTDSLEDINIQTLAQHILTNRRAAASMGYNLIGQNSINAAGMNMGQHSMHGLPEKRPLTTRSKTTPSNMKFMEPNANFAPRPDNNTLNMRNDASVYLPTEARLGYQEPNPFLEQIHFARPNLNVPTNLQHSIDSTSRPLIDPLLAAELQVMRMRQEQGNQSNINFNSDLQTLALLQLAGSRMNVNNNDVLGDMQFRNQIQHLFQSEIQLQNEVERLRRLHEVQNESDHQVRDQNDAARAFLKEFSRNGQQPFGS